MAGRDDAANERGMARGDPAEREEGRLDAGLGEQVEHEIGVELDARLQPVPVAGRKHALERADLEPLLDVDGERVAHQDV